MIRYVPHHAIDKAAWDARLERCANALWYGRSAILDAASPGWDALIDEEAGAQLAIPWRRRFGIPYAYQPFVIQQLGPFMAAPSPAGTTRFLQAWPDRFRYADIYLCPGEAQARQPGVTLSEQVDLLLPLNAPIEALRARYSTNHARNLKKPVPAGMTFGPVDVEEVIAFLERSEQFRRWGIDPLRRAAMGRILRAAAADGTGFGRGMRVGGELAAAGFFALWGGRLIFLKGLATARGRELRAMHHLMDQVIAAHAGRPLTLDFAGSNDPQLARFYAGFGAGRMLYLRAVVNRLPPLIRRLKQ